MTKSSVIQARIAGLFMANGWSLDFSKSVEDEGLTLTKDSGGMKGWIVKIKPEATFWWKGDDDWPFAERKNAEIIRIMEDLTEI